MVGKSKFNELEMYNYSGKKGNDKTLINKYDYH